MRKHKPFQELSAEVREALFRQITCVCARCGYSWMPRSTVLPKRCPSCKSPYWDRERKRRDER